MQKLLLVVIIAGQLFCLPSPSAASSKSETFHISVFIPAIPGINAPVLEDITNTAADHQRPDVEVITEETAADGSTYRLRTVVVR